MDINHSLMTHSLGTNMIPFVVAVSGHRDLLVDDDLTLRVDQILDQIEKEARVVGKGKVPLLLLSALAEGADQFVARRVLIRNMDPARKQKWSVAAVIPMPLADYLKDFKDENAQSRFDELKSQCFQMLALPWADSLDVDIQSMDKDDAGKRRVQQYRNQSLFVTRHAQLVLALWNMHDPGGAICHAPGACGAAYVVRLCREGLPPPAGEILATPEHTSVVEILVRGARRENPSPPADYIDLKGHLSEVQQDELKHFMRAFRGFNHLVTARLGKDDESESSPRLSGSHDRLQEQSIQDPSTLSDEGTNVLIDFRDIAAGEARRLQKNRNLGALMVSILVVSAAIFHEVNAITNNVTSFVAYAVLIGLAYSVYLLLFKLNHADERWVDCRAIAEGLRVQTYWRLEGIRDCVSDHYFHMSKGRIGWIREALRNMLLLALLKSDTPRCGMKLASDSWIAGQIKYYGVQQRAAAEDEGFQEIVRKLATAALSGKEDQPNEGAALRSKRLHLLLDTLAVWVMYLGFLFVALSGLPYVCSFVGHGLSCADSLELVFTSASTIILILAATLKGYSVAMGYEEQMHNYEKMGQVYLSAHEYLRVEGANDPLKRRQCIYALGREALAENAEWVIHHRRSSFEISS